MFFFAVIEDWHHCQKLLSRLSRFEGFGWRAIHYRHGVNLHRHIACLKGIDKDNMCKSCSELTIRISLSHDHTFLVFMNEASDNLWKIYGRLEVCEEQFFIVFRTLSVVLCTLV